MPKSSPYIDPQLFRAALIGDKDTIKSMIMAGYNPYLPDNQGKYLMKIGISRTTKLVIDAYYPRYIKTIRPNILPWFIPYKGVYGI
jgi:hypothetical protein